MGLRRGLPALVGAAVIVCVLAGCAGTAGPSQEQRADVTRFVQASLDQAWRGDGRFDRPSAIAPRFLLPNGWGFAMRQCMVDAGFDDYDFNRSGGFTNGVQRTSSSGTEGLAWYYCSARFPTYDTIFSQLDDTQLEALYAYYTERLVPCLALEGVAVLKIPTRAEFAAGGAGQPGSWNPYLTARLPSSIAVASAVLGSCSPYPEGWQQTLRASQ